MPSQPLTRLAMFPFKSFSFGATGQGPPLDDTKVRDLGDLEKLPATAHDHDFTPGRRVRLCGVGRIDVLAQNHPQRGTGHLGWRLRHGCGSADSPRPPASATSAGGSRPLSVPTAPPGCASATPATRSTASARKRPDVRVLLGGGYAVRAPLVASAAGKPSRRGPVARGRPSGISTRRLPSAGPIRDGLNNSPERVSGCDHGASGERGAPCSSVRSAASSTSTRRSRRGGRRSSSAWTGLSPGLSWSSASRRSTRSVAADAARTRCA